MYRYHIKRFLDLLFALYLLLPITLVVLACALLVMLEDWGPAFYMEKRVGRYGSMYKTFRLRTKKINGLGPTNMGEFMIKTGIDGISQVFNILTGDMSFIGPRYELWDDLRSFTLGDLRKLQVHPGIIGYNQTFCRDSADCEQELKNDIYYADNVSVSLDFKILSRTIQADLFSKGI